jgi:hypothetical protein
MPFAPTGCGNEWDLVDFWWWAIAILSIPM